MADKYLLPEATLMGLAPVVDRPMPKDFRSFEGVRVALSYETIVAVRRVQARQETLAHLAEADELIVRPELPLHSLKENPDQLGASFRKQFGFSVVDQLRTPIARAFRNLRIRVEDLGVSVYIEPLGDDDSRGVSIFFNDFPAIIIDQHEKHDGARLFTLFHELCHLLVRQTGVSNFSNRNDVERFCNRFAAAFLMPREAVEAVIALPQSGTIDPSISDLAFGAEKLCVTISQLALRLEQLGLADAGYFKRITAQLRPPTPPKKRKGGDWKYTFVSRYGYNLPTAVIGSLGRGQIGPVDAARILEVSPDNLGDVKSTIDDRRLELMLG
jgi:Zn-dependent peptidase ImmA (M78 family)